MASVRANPNIAALNKSSFNIGFLEIPDIRDAKISPIPIPAPASPQVDRPAPIFCAACKSKSRRKKRPDEESSLFYLQKRRLCFC